MLWPALGKFCEQNWRFLQVPKPTELPMTAHARGLGACLRKILNFSSSDMAF